MESEESFWVASQVISAAAERAIIFRKSIKNFFFFHTLHSQPLPALNSVSTPTFRPYSIIQYDTLFGFMKHIQIKLNK